MFEKFRKSYSVGSFYFKSYVELNDDEAKEILKARNAECVRKWMIITDEIKLDEHLNYIQKLKNSEKKFYWAVYQEDKFLGGISLIGFENNRGDSGIFLNPILIGNGLGMKISICSFEFYFYTLKIDSLYSVVHKENKNAIKMNKFLGCSFGEHSDSFYSIELTKEQWALNRNRLLRLL